MVAFIRLAVGLAIGAGIGAAATKLLTRDEEAATALAETGEPSTGGIGARLRLASEQARAARAVREAQLQETFRQRVGDSRAFAPSEEQPAI